MINRFLHLKYILITGFVTTMAICSLASTVVASSASNTEDRRVRCLTILRKAMVTDEDFWVSVHSAEALISNGYFDGVKENFIAREDTAGAAHRIGIWSVLAQISRNNPVEHDIYTGHILDAFIEPSSHNRNVAGEILGKLGFSKRLPEIVLAAEEGESKIKGCARWILANSGNPDDESYFAELLKSDKSAIYGLAGYGISFFNKITPKTYTLLEECKSRLLKNAENRVSIVCALYIHAPQEKEKKAKQELVEYAGGNKYERYEVCEGLSYRCDESDIVLLETMLADPETDVRVSSANALIRIERRQFRGMMWPDWVVIGGYALFMVGIGWFYLNRQKNTEDYLLGGRKLNPVATGISLFATMLSTISYLGAPGEVVKHGPIYILFPIATIPITYLILGYCFIPLFMKLKITSAYEILEKPLGVGVRLFGSMIFIITRITWMALLIFLTAKALITMMNWDNSFIPFITVAIGAITLIYSTMGGLRAVVTTDVIQALLLFMGAVLTILLITAKMGGPLEWFPTSWAPAWDRFVIFSFNPLVRVTVLGTMVVNTVWWVCTASSDQMAIQRYISTRDVKSARKALLTTNFFEALILVLLTLVGFAVLGFFNANPHLVADRKSIIGDADLLFPYFIANFVPIGITGLVVSGLFSASMSSLSSGINSTVSVVLSDFINRFIKKKDSETHQVRLARWVSIYIGVFVLMISFLMNRVPGNIIEVMAKTYNIFVAPLFILFFMALFVPFATPIGAIFGSVYGFYGGMIIAFWDLLTGQTGLSFQWIMPISLLCAVVFGILFSLLPTRGKSIKIQILWCFILCIPLVVTFFLLRG